MHIFGTYVWVILIQTEFKDSSKMDFDGFPICESCLEGEMTKRPFNAKGRRAQELLELVHSDVCDLMSIQARCGYEYLLPSLMITLDLVMCT